MSQKWNDVKSEFIEHWGNLGNAWGVNRTMAQIGALLMVSPDPLCTDQIMEELGLSRGNVHNHIKDLQSWNMIRTVKISGDRKEYFTAEKDPWKMVCLLAREKQRREVEPTLDVLRECLRSCSDMDDREENKREIDPFVNQLTELEGFLEQTSKVLGRLSKSEKSTVLKWLMKML